MLNNMQGTGLILGNNNIDRITLNSNGAFSFPTRVNSNSSYSVSVLTNPTSEACTVLNGTGTVLSSNINNIQINCSPAPTSINYSSNNYIFRPNTLITTITPTLTGTITSCTATPSLPTGLSINNTNCSITGTPTTIQTTTSYLITASNANVNITTTITISVQSDLYRFFITTNSYNGNLMSAGLGANGIIGADNLCNSDPNKPNSSNYKAVIMDQTNRIGVPSFVDWPLLPNTTYIRATDSATIFTTNATSIFNFGTLTNSIDSGSPKEYWTGFQQGGTDWALSTQRCTNWTGTGSTARYGISDSFNYNAFAFSISSSCTNLKRILCVEQ